MCCRDFFVVDCWVPTLGRPRISSTLGGTVPHSRSSAHFVVSAGSSGCIRRYEGRKSSLLGALAGGAGSTIRWKVGEAELGYPRRRRKIADGSPPLEVRRSCPRRLGRIEGIVGSRVPSPLLRPLSGRRSCRRWLGCAGRSSCKAGGGRMGGRELVIGWMGGGGQMVIAIGEVVVAS